MRHRIWINDLTRDLPERRPFKQEIKMLEVCVRLKSKQVKLGRLTCSSGTDPVPSTAKNMNISKQDTTLKAKQNRVN